MNIKIELEIGLSAALMHLLDSAQSLAIGKADKAAAGKPEPSPAPTAAAPTPAVEQSASAAEASPAASDPNDVDAHGWPWSADMHASTKGMTKEGLWRMKVGVTRPDPKPGFPIADAGSTSTENTGAAAPSPNEAAPAETAGAVEEDDEFAAFRKAAEESNAADEAVVVPARKWTDADLSALCNQAAVKLGDPMPVKAIIAEFVPAGEVQHSRMIPEANRAAFAAALEAKAGIQFAG